MRPSTYQTYNLPTIFKTTSSTSTTLADGLCSCGRFSKYHHRSSQFKRPSQSKRKRSFHWFTCKAITAFKVASVLPMLITLLFTALTNVGYGRSLEKILKELDHTIAQSPSMDSDYVHSINQIKELVPRDSLDLYNKNNQLFLHYQFFNADSALTYADQNIALAHQLGRDDLVTESMLFKVDELSRCGIFNEARSLLDMVKKPQRQDLLEMYYLTQYNLNQYLQEYLADTDYTDNYKLIKLAYADSILNTFSPESFFYTMVLVDKNIGEGVDFEEVNSYIEDKLKLYHPGHREYSILSSLQAFNYQANGDIEQAQKTLAQAAISDVLGSVKENTSLRTLSQICMQLQEVQRANTYLSKSFADATFFSSKLRNNQAAVLLPLIADAYQSEQSRRTHELVWMLVIIGVLAVVLAIAVVYIRKQLARLSGNHKQLQQAKEEAENVNNSLNEVNHKLEQLNHQLHEANKVKETYVSQFILLCSSSINNMEKYRNKLYTLSRSSSVKELQNALTSTKDINDSIKGFYQAFDEAFLQIFPMFIQNFNALLTSPSKEHENGLTTEQRIYALVRLGLNDNQKIAEFLHCSLSTIYSYRSKLRTSALNPETFEQDIMEIGRL